jgi:ankyrin repeat protein
VRRLLLLGPCLALILLVTARLSEAHRCQQLTAQLVQTLRDGIPSPRVAVLLANGADPDVRLTPGLGPTPLMMAGQFGDLTTTQVLVEHGASVNAVDRLGRTALGYAARHAELSDLVPVARYLLAHGAVVTDRRGRTCELHTAAARGELAAVKEAISRGPSVDEPDGIGWTPLMWATLGEHRPVVEYLLARGADPTVGNKRHTALGIARGLSAGDLVDRFTLKGGPGSPRVRAER